jgi:hypothetical protein
VQPRLIEVHYDLITRLETQPPAILRGYDDPTTLTEFCLDLIHASSSNDLTTDQVYGGIRTSVVKLFSEMVEARTWFVSVRSPF